MVTLAGSAAKRNLRLPALRGSFDRSVNRHVLILNPAAAVRGVKETLMEGKTPGITVGAVVALLASIDTENVVGLRGKTILAKLPYTACRAGAVAR